VRVFVKEGANNCKEPKINFGIVALSLIFANALRATITASDAKERNSLAGEHGSMKRVIHFEIYTDNPEAVQPFYQDVFGWKFQKFEGGPLEYWLITTGDDKDPGINGGLARPRQGQDSGTINTVAVPSLDRSIKKIEESGGKICVPKMKIPNIGWLAYAQDPAGNIFGIIEPVS
jgi:predicted enzyme related to lactoylglutathione lyase